VRDRVRDIAKQPFFDVYITPIALAFIYQGLEFTPAPNALGAHIAVDILMQLIDEGSLSVTSCPPSKYPSESGLFNSWLEQNLKIRHCIVEGVIDNSVPRVPGLRARLSRAAVELLSLCTETLRDSPAEDESDLERLIESDISQLQMTSVGLETWRRYILILSEDAEDAEEMKKDALVAKNGIERLKLRWFKFHRTEHKSSKTHRSQSRS